MNRVTVLAFAIAAASSVFVVEELADASAPIEKSPEWWQENAARIRAAITDGRAVIDGGVITDGRRTLLIPPRAISPEREAHLADAGWTDYEITRLDIEVRVDHRKLNRDAEHMMVARTARVPALEAEVMPIICNGSAACESGSRFQRYVGRASDPTTPIGMIALISTTPAQREVARGGLLDRMVAIEPMLQLQRCARRCVRDEVEAWLLSLDPSLVLYEPEVDEGGR